MRHPGQALRREDIIENIWDFDFDSMSNIIDVYINRLREKIGDKNGQVIETVRGVGYRLKV
jgi:two component transcriptional regulator, winged helix family